MNHPLLAFGQNNENVARNIMLQIIDEKDLQTVIKTYPLAYNIYHTPRFWVDRLEMYYPDFVKDKVDFPRLTHHEFYQLINLFHSFKVNGDEYGNKSFKYNPNLIANCSQNNKTVNVDKDNFDGNYYCPTKDVANITLHKEYDSETYSIEDIFNDRNVSKYNMQIAKKLGEFLHTKYNELNLEKMFSERFIVRLLLKGRCCREFDSYIYSKIIEFMLADFQDDYEHMYDDSNYNNDRDYDSEEDEVKNRPFYCPQAQFIFKISSHEVTGLYKYVDEGLFP